MYLTATHAKAVVSAIVGALIAAGSALITALQGEHAGLGTITASQWVASWSRSSVS